MTIAEHVIYARMQALTARIAAGDTAYWGHEEEAKKIMALVNPPPLDPDTAEVRKINDAKRIGCGMVEYGLLCLKRGRELAKAEQSTEAVELLDRAHRSCSMGSSLYEDIDAYLVRHNNETGQAA